MQKGIRSSLLENSDPSMRFKCTVCFKDLSPDNLVPSNELRQKMDQYLRAFAVGKLAADKEESVQDPLKRIGPLVSSSPPLIRSQQPAVRKVCSCN